MSKPNEVHLPDHLVYAQAVEAMRKYHEAKDMGEPPEEVERLRLIAEAHAQAVTDYQIKALSGRGAPAH